MTRTSRTPSNSSRRYSPTSATNMVELKSIRGDQNSVGDSGVSVSLPLSNMRQQLCPVPIPSTLPSAPVMNVNANTNATPLHLSTRIHTDNTATSTPPSLPHPYNLSQSPSPTSSTSHSLAKRLLPFPLLKTTTRRLLTAIGLVLSLTMTWWTYASLEAAREANRLAELANLLAFRAECRGFMSGGTGTGEVEPGCEEALAREIVVKRGEYGEVEDIRNSGIRRQGDSEIMYGGMEEQRKIDDNYALQWAKRAASVLSRGDTEGLWALELDDNNLGILHQWTFKLAYGDPDRQRVRLWMSGLRDLLDMFGDGPQYYAPLRNTSRLSLSDLLRPDEDRLFWNVSSGMSGDEFPVYEWVDGSVWSRYGCEYGSGFRSGRDQSLSSIATITGGTGVDVWTGLEMIVCHIMWLLPIWIVLRTAWISLGEKSGLASEGKRKDNRNGKGTLEEKEKEKKE